MRERVEGNEKVPLMNEEIGRDVLIITKSGIKLRESDALFE
jgi:hypothetical protein